MNVENGLLNIRDANAADAGLILRLIGELAEYERLSHEVVATEDDLRERLFGDAPQAEVVIAEWEGDAAGFVLFFHNFSTFLGKRGLYLEDLFVRPAFRGRGIGKALLRHLAKIALERDCGRFEWSVLEWNRPAIDFYKSLGAVPMDEWTVYRLSGDALARFAGTKTE